MPPVPARVKVELRMAKNIGRNHNKIHAQWPAVVRVIMLICECDDET